jgi:hypothetical protein
MSPKEPSNVQTCSQSTAIPTPNLYYSHLPRAYQMYQRLESMPGVDKRRLFNRDLAAVLNFREILLSLRPGNGIPLRYRRDQKRDASISPS